MRGEEVAALLEETGQVVELLLQLELPAQSGGQITEFSVFVLNYLV